MPESPDEDVTTVPIVCEACGTTTRIAVDDVAAAIDRHNERRHDGEPIAAIDPVIRDELATLVAEDLDLL